jgi:hypothetical protein
VGRQRAVEPLLLAQVLQDRSITEELQVLTLSVREALLSQPTSRRGGVIGLLLDTRQGIGYSPLCRSDLIGVPARTGSIQCLLSLGDPGVRVSEGLTGLREGQLGLGGAGSVRPGRCLHAARRRRSDPGRPPLHRSPHPAVLSSR